MPGILDYFLFFNQTQTQSELTFPCWCSGLLAWSPKILLDMPGCFLPWSEFYWVGNEMVPARLRIYFVSFSYGPHRKNSWSWEQHIILPSFLKVRKFPKTKTHLVQYQWHLGVVGLTNSVFLGPPFLQLFVISNCCRRALCPVLPRICSTSQPLVSVVWCS